MALWYYCSVEQQREPGETLITAMTINGFWHVFLDTFPGRGGLFWFRQCQHLRAAELGERFDDRCCGRASWVTVESLAFHKVRRQSVKEACWKCKGRIFTKAKWLLEEAGLEERQMDKSSIIPFIFLWNGAPFWEQPRRRFLFWMSAAKLVLDALLVRRFRSGGLMNV